MTTDEEDILLATRALGLTRLPHAVARIGTILCVLRYEAKRYTATAFDAERGMYYKWRSLQTRSRPEANERFAAFVAEYAE
jgi:hypothetical protein